MALQNHAAKTQDTLVDAVVNAEFAEFKGAVFRALTRLRAATNKEFDTIADIFVPRADRESTREPAVGCLSVPAVHSGIPRADGQHTQSPAVGDRRVTACKYQPPPRGFPGEVGSTLNPRQPGIVG